MNNLPNSAALPIANAVADVASDTAAASGRQGNGQFAAGNTYAAGTAVNRQAALLREAFAEAVTPEKARAIAKMLVDKAVEGNVAAAKLVLQYSLGKSKFAIAAADDAAPLPSPAAVELLPIPPRPIPAAKPGNDDMPPWMQELAAGLPRKEVEAIFGKPKKTSAAPTSHGVVR